MALSDYCTAQVEKIYPILTEEIKKQSPYQIARIIGSKIKTTKNGEYDTDTLARSVALVQGRDRNSTTSAKLAPVGRGFNTPVSTNGGVLIPNGNKEIMADIIHAMNNNMVGKFDNIFNSDEKEFGIPEGLPEADRFFKIPIPKDNYKVLCIFDAHIPVHCEKTLAHAFRHGKKNNVDCILFGGDMLDWYSLSIFEKSKKYNELQSELDTCNLFLQALRKAFPTQKVIWMDGNHDFRIERFKMRGEGRALAGLEALETQNLLSLKDFNIDYYDNYATLQIGKLNVMHGHKLRGSGASVAMSKLKNALVNIMFGHHHIVQDAFLKDLLGAVIGAYAVGCSCQLRPDYSIHNAWMNGFAEIEVNMDGDFTVDNKKIINGEIR